MEIRWAKSSRKHRIGRARALAVIAAPAAMVRQQREDGTEVLMFLGDDETGRALEVGAVDLGGDVLLVIHVMDLRDKFRDAYNEGKEE